MGDALFFYSAGVREPHPAAFGMRWVNREYWSFAVFNTPLGSSASIAFISPGFESLTHRHWVSIHLSSDDLKTDVNSSPVLGEVSA
jgi:hypothetical protein